MVLVTTSTNTGVCCNESGNPTGYMSSRFCNISGNIFLFTSEADVGMAKIITTYCSSTSVFMTNNTHSGAKI